MNRIEHQEANLERFMGFAALYDDVRPTPPKIIQNILHQYVGNILPLHVIDIGSGTGLSTFYWSDIADSVIGLEPSIDMLRRAQINLEKFQSQNSTLCQIKLLQAYSHETNIPSHSAHIITCVQSLHWMDPLPTFQEVKRLLVPGGVFAAIDY